MKVLVVEDSSAMRNVIASTAEEVAGVTAVQAQNGFEALKLLPSGDFALIITDINMPDLNGLELIRYIRQHPRYQSTPLFIVTTEGSDTDRQRGLALGVNEYLIKPFDPRALKTLINKYLVEEGANRGE